MVDRGYHTTGYEPNHSTNEELEKLKSMKEELKLLPTLTTYNSQPYIRALIKILKDYDLLYYSNANLTFRIKQDQYEIVHNTFNQMCQSGILARTKIVTMVSKYDYSERLKPVQKDAIVNLIMTVYVPLAKQIIEAKGTPVRKPTCDIKVKQEPSDTTEQPTSEVKEADAGLTPATESHPSDGTTKPVEGGTTDVISRATSSATSGMQESDEEDDVMIIGTSEKPEIDPFNKTFFSLGANEKLYSAADTLNSTSSKVSVSSYAELRKTQTGADVNQNPMLKLAYSQLYSNQWVFVDRHTGKRESNLQRRTRLALYDGALKATGKLKSSFDDVARGDLATLFYIAASSMTISSREFVKQRIAAVDNFRKLTAHSIETYISNFSKVVKKLKAVDDSYTEDKKIEDLLLSLSKSGDESGSSSEDNRYKPKARKMLTAIQTKPKSWAAIVGELMIEGARLADTNEYKSVSKPDKKSKRLKGKGLAAKSRESKSNDTKANNSKTSVSKFSKLGAKKQPCLFYLKTGGCKYGDDCKFAHSWDEIKQACSKLNKADNPKAHKAEGKESKPADKPDLSVKFDRPCMQYKRTGNCSYGKNCKFSHDCEVDKSAGKSHLAVGKSDDKPISNDTNESEDDNHSDFADCEEYADSETDYHPSGEECSDDAAPSLCYSDSEVSDSTANESDNTSTTTLTDMDMDDDSDSFSIHSVSDSEDAERVEYLNASPPSFDDVYTSESDVDSLEAETLATTYL